MQNINNIFLHKYNICMSLTENDGRIFYCFHSLRKLASFQHSYMASTAEAKIFCSEWSYIYLTSTQERTFGSPLTDGVIAVWPQAVLCRTARELARGITVLIAVD